MAISLNSINKLNSIYVLDDKCCSQLKNLYITYAHSLNFNTIWEKGKKNETFDKAFGGNIRFFVLFFLVKDRISPSQYLFNDKLHVNISIYWKNWFNWNCRHSIFNFHILRRLSVRRFPFRSVHNSHWNTQIESHKMQYKFNQFFIIFLIWNHEITKNQMSKLYKQITRTNRFPLKQKNDQCTFKCYDIILVGHSLINE